MASVDVKKDEQTVAPRRPMTADEFLMLPDDHLRHELVRGELTTMSLPDNRHGEVTFEIGMLIGMHVRALRLGTVYAAETGFLLARNPDTVRGCDVGFVRAERIAQMAERPKYFPFAPDLVVEVKSPNDRPAEIAEKTREWLDAGALAVWNVDHEARTVAVHRPGAEPIILSENDTIDGGDALPGFRGRVGEFFP